MDELTCVPETQQSHQAAGVEELVVGVDDPLQILGTEQGDIVLETQQDLDSSDEDTQNTQAAGGTQKGKGKGKGRGKSSREGQQVLEEKADKKSKKPTVLFSAKVEQKLVDFLRDNEILYNKRLMDYKDRFYNNVNAARTCCPQYMQKNTLILTGIFTVKSFYI